jgi:hypothetical protein
MAEDQLEIEIEEDKDEWSKVDPRESKEETPKVEFEIESDPKESLKTKEESVKPPKELDGIETKGAQKRIRQLIKQRKDRDDQLVNRETRIRELEDTIKKQTTEYTKTQKANMDATGKAIADRITQAQHSYKAALESEDTDAIVQAQTNLSQSQAEMMLNKQSQEAYKDFEDTEEPKETIQAPQPQEANYYPKAVAWTEDNTWFGEDKVLTAAALHIDAQLKAEGFDPSDDEFYDEVDQRLRENFPKKFDVAQEEQVEELVEETQEPKPRAKVPQMVAGGSRTTAPTLSGGKSNKVKLTREDVAMAQKWDIPLDRFAASKLEAEAADGEYSTININRGGK